MTRPGTNPACEASGGRPICQGAGRVRLPAGLLLDKNPSQVDGSDEMSFRIIITLICDECRAESHHTDVGQDCEGAGLELERWRASERGWKRSRPKVNEANRDYCPACAKRVIDEKAATKTRR